MLNRAYFTRPRGFIVAETIGGLLLIAVIGSLLVVAASRQHRVAARLAADRAAARQAESVLLDLAAGHAPTSRPTNATVRVMPTVAPSGFVWVEVSVASDRREVRLVGLAATGTVTR